MELEEEFLTSVFQKTSACVKLRKNMQEHSDCNVYLYSQSAMGLNAMGVFKHTHTRVCVYVCMSIFKKLL